MTYRYYYMSVAVLSLGACATVDQASNQQFVTNTNTIQSLETRAVDLYCQADPNGRLMGRGGAGGIAPIHGLTAGSYVISTMMMGMGPLIALEDREALEKKVQQVLDDETDGRKLDWKAPSTGQKVIMRPGKTKSSFRLVSVPRADEVGKTPESFRVEQGEFITTKSAALRPSPTSSSNVRIDTVPAGVRLQLMGRVRGMYSDDWYMVGADGRSYGYMEPADLRPAIDSDPVDFYHRVTGPTMRDPIPATVTCRELAYETDMGTETMQACRSPEGKWIADPPEGDAAANKACQPVSRPYLLR
ncbi:hypothetical protein [Hirschia baltica]|uniref:SH3b domain-containing protein n=1 Tax=Hirschia baltica (strain ATCC 49814 / DSM 5838 / IFAM 1418) TaxID=582402 RepID=C6XJZ8_HIRBI|nr:hypothetical protein [Hirschia baltica]ACT59443.1 hypothetical protein Hbal_1755 [Hirschia baltica ATCC 49814]